MEPRLAQLLGLGEAESPDRQDLFAAWRLFFERLAEVYPTVLAFEDMQWADASLLDFVEHLLDWSRNHSLYVITLARPELVERRPTWGAGQRNFTSIYLDPLSEEAMGDLLDGLVPGLPAEAREQILARAEGVPLYAVETVRMLLDRGDLVQDGAVYRPAREIASLDVPETLHALIAARLDGLSPDERRLLQDGAVLGKTFTERGLAALGGSGGADLGPSSQGSSARRCSRSRPTRARPSTASTVSSRTSSVTSRTRRSRAANGGHVISPPRRTSRRASARTRSPR